ncbi:ClbS/DfsB family four-helix bundle protein [Aureitalea sp. L0-47]|uniref:ClbS/DfsB family four-helix bundle protein n=1 Tax=Aureitalea sp. L0-47 TaxID=2816962 RepID=UPI00223901A2|nr:ClbS/DfsB family four-helix bundle protein [Aureitalea sp. L0-47]MCW5519764.1 ClbS/DfsB family four-helix bundle protein [Aureitalea sp. L0-47]
MGRPKNKTDLLSLSKANYRRLMELIDSYSEEEKNKDFPPGTLNRNIRDVLGHLHHWHTMFLQWYKVGMAGSKPDMPAKEYSWKKTPELNAMIQRKYENVPLYEMSDLFERSFCTVYQIIEKHTNEELFTKKRYKWTRSTSLGAYLVSATSSHYNWAIKLIKRCKK